MHLPTVTGISVKSSAPVLGTGGVGAVPTYPTGFEIMI